jgi:hypothetical protein
MHLVGYLYDDYHDAQSLERKVLFNVFWKLPVPHFSALYNLCLLLPTRYVDTCPMILVTNSSVCAIEMQCVPCALRTECLITVYMNIRNSTFRLGGLGTSLGQFT